VHAFFLQAEDGIRDGHVTGVQTCALPISAQGIAYPEMVRHQQEVADIIERDPNVLSAMNILNGGNNGNFQIMLKPRAERKLSAEDRKSVVLGKSVEVGARSEEEKKTRGKR